MNIFGYVEFNSEEEARKATDAEVITLRAVTQPPTYFLPVHH